jgi:hypothetical protein
MHLPIATGPRRRTRRAVLAAFVPAALAAAALPPGASAATLRGADGTLFYQGGSERNSLSIREVDGAVIVSDPAGLSNAFLSFTTRGPCVGIDRNTMRCPGVERIDARMAGGDDRVGPFNTRFPVVVRGESGNDTYEADSPSFLTSVKFSGGSGFDTASYAGSNGSVAGGARISNDGIADDGRRGLDADNVDRDVERLIGSRLADEITANGPLDLRSTGVFAFTEVHGGRGDDVLRVGADGNPGVRILNGRAADGADKVIGGPASSFVDYSERTRGVTGTLNFGGADDGEAGEGDELLGGHEVLLGSQASDILRAPFGSKASHSIEGNGGGDFIEGADGPDRLAGGPGIRDVIVAAGGDDLVLAKDGERDELDCGPGSDSFDVDAVDSLASCENGTVGVLRLAPRALRAEAGEVARLRLSWRHPKAWKQLKKIELRLTQDGGPVGGIAIRPRSERAADDGAVRVKRIRIRAHGKTVSAKLALRFDRSLAGRTLKAEVEATDRRGAVQLERDAGTVRVAR